MLAALEVEGANDNSLDVGHLELVHIHGLLEEFNVVAEFGVNKTGDDNTHVVESAELLLFHFFVHANFVALDLVLLDKVAEKDPVDKTN